MTDPEAVQETIDAHVEATGHDEVDALVQHGFPSVLTVWCSACGVHLGSVMAMSREKLGERLLAEVES